MVQKLTSPDSSKPPRASIVPQSSSCCLKVSAQDEARESHIPNCGINHLVFWGLHLICKAHSAQTTLRTYHLLIVRITVFSGSVFSTSYLNLSVVI